MKRYLTISFIVHTALVAAMFLPAVFNVSGTYPEGAKDQGSGGQRANIVMRIAKIEVSVAKPLTQKDSKVVVKRKDRKPAAVKLKGVHECKGSDWYGGIGIVQSLNSVIESVVPGYPADVYGLKVGDRFVPGPDNKMPEIRGAPGTTVVVHVLRDMSLLTISIVRDRICTEG